MPGDYITRTKSEYRVCPARKAVAPGALPIKKTRTTRRQANEQVIPHPIPASRYALYRETDLRYTGVPISTVSRGQVSAGRMLLIHSELRHELHEPHEQWERLR